LGTAALLAVARLASAPGRTSATVRLLHDLQASPDPSTVGPLLDTSREPGVNTVTGCAVVRKSSFGRQVHDPSHSRVRADLDRPAVAGFGSFPAYGGLGAPQGGPNSRAGVVRFDLTAARCGAPAAQRLIERVGEQLTGPSDGRPRIRRTRTRLVRGQGSRSERTDG
jgi:hypothetical protein